MRLKVTSSKNEKFFYIIKTVYENKKEKTITVEKLGSESSLREKLGNIDLYAWARNRALELTKLEEENNRLINLSFSPNNLIPSNKQTCFNCGYLFLKKIYHDLGVDKISKQISKKYKFSFDLNSILSRLIYSRIIFPSSKLSTFELSKNFLEKPNFELNHIYHALDIISNESNFIQSELYKNNKLRSKRNDNVLYYDCTNYFFEIEQDDGLKQYGLSKDHRPNPLVQMGLFMDGDGIPLAFSINSGNTNEQTTLIPLEKQIETDFKHSKFIVCTDAGLFSSKNKIFNNTRNKGFITTQSIKKLKSFLVDWALDKHGWHLLDSTASKSVYNLDDVENSLNFYILKHKVFYKERWIKENGTEERLIVTFSFKYRDYHQTLRDRNIQRALVSLNNPNSINRKRNADSKRFIRSKSITKDGEVADKTIYDLDVDKIAQETCFDGFYAISTNLLDNAKDIAEISHKRWEIEECFRIMKTEFKARPVYLRKDNRIIAHFTTCFLSLVIFRYLEKYIDKKASASEIIKTLKDMNMLKIKSEGYIPTYSRTELTDILHEKIGFRTDYDICTNKHLKKIFKITKK